MEQEAGDIAFGDSISTAGQLSRALGFAV